MPEENSQLTVPTFDENVATVVAGLPPPVRAFITGPDRDRVTAAITQKNNLHADQAGQFQRAFLFMLMGIYSPERYEEALVEAGINEATIAALSNDVNEMVFKPIQEKERAPAPPLAPPAPRPTPPPPISVPPPAAAPVVPPPPPAPIAPPPPPPVYVPPTPPPPVAAPPAPPAAEHPTMRTMATDIQAVKEHRPVEPFFMQHGPNVSYETPVAHTAPRIAPPPAAPPAPAPRPPAAEHPPMPRSNVAPPDNLPGAPVVHEYNVDPYREPVE